MEIQEKEKKKLSEDLVKHDTGKARYSLIPVEPLHLLAKLYTFGCDKYGAHNWRKGASWSRIYDAMMRHANAFWSGENIDPETGIPHLTAVAWNAFALCEFMNEGIGVDDRNCPKESK